MFDIRKVYFRKEFHRISWRIGGSLRRLSSPAKGRKIEEGAFDPSRSRRTGNSRSVSFVNSPGSSIISVAIAGIIRLDARLMHSRGVPHKAPQHPSNKSRLISPKLLRPLARLVNRVHSNAQPRTRRAEPILTIDFRYFVIEPRGSLHLQITSRRNAR